MICPISVTVFTCHDMISGLHGELYSFFIFKEISHGSRKVMDKEYSDHTGSFSFDFLFFGDLALS